MERKPVSKISSTEGKTLNVMGQSNWLTNLFANYALIGMNKNERIFIAACGREL